MSLQNRVRNQRNQRRIQESDEDEKYSFANQRAFCELVVYIHEQYTSNSSQSDKPVVFRLVDLCELYEKRLVQLGIQNHIKNETRLKNMLLKHIPELDSFKSGREVVFTFKENVGRLLSESSKYDQAIIIEKAAQILRKQMLLCKSKFEGNFEEDYIDKCVPEELIQFVQSTLYGTQINSDEQSLL